MSDELHDLKPAMGPLDAPLRSDEPRIEFACPCCRVRLESYQSTCPACGVSLESLYSGQFQLRRGRGTQVVVWVILVLFALSVLAVLIGTLVDWVGG